MVIYIQRIYDQIVGKWKILFEIGKIPSKSKSQTEIQETNIWSCTFCVAKEIFFEPIFKVSSLNNTISKKVWTIQDFRTDLQEWN